MIFVTVGAQMPFDRLIEAVDRWAARAGYGNVFAQIGPGRYQPRHMRFVSFLDPPGFRSIVRDARLIVAHAGMGSIISAMECGKPILVMPRRGDLAETRNDHQLATAARFSEMGLVSVALDAGELERKLTTFARGGSTAAAPPARCRLSDGRCALSEGDACGLDMQNAACARLIQGLRDFIHGLPVPLPAPAPGHPAPGVQAPPEPALA